MTQAKGDQVRQCPECGTRLVFAPDGSALICERCGYRRAVARKRPSARELVKLQQFRLNQPGRTESRSAGVRNLMRQGIAAARSGNKDEAFDYLEWALRTEASIKQMARVWLWLSEVYEKPADKRECLEQVLALDPANPLARRGLAVLDGRLNPEEIVDPDQLPTPDADAVEPASAEQFTCPRCSARMNYAADGRSLVCEFCDYRQELTPDDESAAPEPVGIGAMEQDFIAALATAKGHLQPVAMRTLQCQSCAVEFVLAPETISLTCPYCESVYVTETAETRELLPPQALIPFTVSLNAAERALRAWFKQHGVERPKVSRLLGLYLPIWTFDVSGQLGWKGLVRRGDDWVPRSGKRPILYDDWLVPASQKLPPPLIKHLPDFDLSALVPYEAGYLADWPAERYTLPLSDASLKARRQILKRMRRRSYKLTGGDAVRDLTLQSREMVVVSFKLILLPIWLTHYRLERATYDVMVNGQTGVVRGERPSGIIGRLISWFRDE